MDDRYNIVVLSNRLPFVLKLNDNGHWERKPSAGGLVTAVAPVVTKTSGRWVGWTGLTNKNVQEIPESLPEDKSPTAGLKSDKIVQVNLTQEEHEMYYNGMCNATLWPLFHTMTDRAVFKAQDWEAYVKVNERFADKAVEALEATQKENPSQIPILWIQDYHLLLVGKMIREKAAKKNLKCVLAFFLHIPFPAFDVFKILPWEFEILDGMLGCDVIGFHHEDYCLNFLESCDRGIGCNSNRKQQVVERNDGRFVMVKSLPISIPYKRFVKLGMSAPNEYAQLNLKVILGVDRLDYTKGLPNRLKAFELFLEEYPEHKGKVMLHQIAVPSRTDVQEYKELKEYMDRLVGAINGKFSTAQWSPIKYMYGCVPQAQLASFYRYADIALITPLRDGMNLVAKEFVACQNLDKPGVLVLSPFAGAGRSMEEALLVNPYELGNVACTLNRALTMDSEERLVRMRGLKARESTHDVHVWMKNFMHSIDSYLEKKDTLITEHSLNFEKTAGKLIETRKNFALLLDFDGTLTPLVSHPTLVNMPQGTKDLLDKLKDMSNVKLAIVSGRQVNDVKEKVGIQNITYAGSHGNVIHFADGSVADKGFDKQVVTELESLLHKGVKEKFEGSWIENKGHTICVHVKHVSSTSRDSAIAEVQKIATNLNFNTSPGHDSIECKAKNASDKGTAVLSILEHMYGSNWANTTGVIYIGDDTTDEDAMKALKDKAITIRILSDQKKQNTAAMMVFPSTRSVVHFLHWFHGKLTGKMDITPAKVSNQPQTALKIK